MTAHKVPFWTNNIKILFTSDNFYKVLPTSTMTRPEQLNTITRLCIYLIVMLVMSGNTEGWIQFPVTVLVFCVLMYYVFDKDDAGKLEDFKRLRGDDMSEPADDDREYEVQVGAHDSNGDLYFSDDSCDTGSCGVDDYSLDELIQYNKARCKRPSRDNPFMNPTLDEFNKPDIPCACNADDEDINEEMKNTYNEDLFRDVNDLFDIKNSQRQFYTVPVTSNPPDTIKFANWLYKTPMTCKNDQERCLRFEDLRFKG